ncbi:MAG: hypothetical protein ACP5E4_00075 [Candidatus Aenigmatarchaeota archaeon]
MNLYNCGNVNKNSAEKAKEFRLKSIFILVIAISFFLMPALAENISSSVDISIDVGSKTIVVVDPDILEWTGAQAVDPGSEGISKAIQIENMGSTNISHIWANTTYESSSPFGSGDASKYDAGNFVALSRTNGTSDYYHMVNRVEYNETHQDIYLTLPTGWIGYGRFRDGSNEYFWVIKNNSANCTDGTFYIGKTHHNSSQTGTVAFSGCDATLNNSAGAGPCRSGTLTVDSTGNWGYGFVFVGNNSNYHNYTVAVHADCNKTMFSYWNKDAPGAEAAGSYTEYLSTSTLYPGSALIVYAKVKVAYGTAAGSITQGSLTIIAESV